MTTPSDRGIVVVKTERHGTKSVLLCTGVRNGVPMDVFAVHFGRSSVVVDPQVEMVRTGDLEHSERMVVVSADADGVVHVQPGRSATIADS